MAPPGVGPDVSSEKHVDMDEGERDDFLGDGGTGVLSLSTTAEDPPHAIPVSYGYDASETTLYFRLAEGPEDSKGNLDGRPVAFVTDDQDRGWKSVVARGHLKDVEREGIATDSLEGLERVDMPLVDVFHAPLREVEFDFFRLVPDEMSGRVESRITED